MPFVDVYIGCCSCKRRLQGFRSRAWASSARGKSHPATDNQKLSSGDALGQVWIKDWADSRTAYYMKDCLLHVDIDGETRATHTYCRRDMENATYL